MSDFRVEIKVIITDYEILCISYENDSESCRLLVDRDQMDSAIHYIKHLMNAERV
jgi:hypothetical protein